MGAPGVSRRAAIGGGIAAAGAGVLVGRGTSLDAFAGRPDALTLRGAHQPGITTPVQNHLHFAAFDVVTESRDELVEMLRAWTAAAERLMSGLPVGPVGPVDGRPELAPDDTGEALDLERSNLSITIGFGPGLFRDAEGNDRFGLGERQPAALRPLPRFPLDALVEGTSGGDICLQACADDPQVAVHAIRNLTRIGFGTVGMRWSQHGFGRSSSTTRGQTTPRNLMGFKDGTANIRAEDTGELDTHVWVAPSDDGGDWLAGGSYLITRRAAIVVETWDRQTLRDQEAFIGRTKGEGAPLTGAQESDQPDLGARTAGGHTIADDAHIRVVHPDNHGGAKMLRRGYNIADGTNEIGRMDAGLFFIAFVRDPDKQFIPIQSAMSRSDALMEYLRFTQSAIFAVPPGAPGQEYVGQALLGA